MILEDHVATQVMNPAGRTPPQGDPPQNEQGRMVMPNTSVRTGSWQDNNGLVPLISATSGAEHCRDAVPSKSVMEDVEVQRGTDPISPLKRAVLAAGAAPGHVVEAATSGSANSLLAEGNFGQGSGGKGQGEMVSN
ncbi:hypothetical protein BTVI_20411 [Pitangus sulphuratus]|nr:hypothetical protein BTVI_20411 [Pitangus sulphuratus]